MKKDADLITKNCTWCSLYAAKPECLIVVTSDQGTDWRQVYIDYLREGSLPIERTESATVVRGARRVFLANHGGRLEATCAKVSAVSEVWQLGSCPFRGTALNSCPLSLSHVGHGFGRPIRPTSRKNSWILAATEVCTKWVEATPLKRVTGEAMAAFIKERVICRFGVPKVILSDNGTPFINHHVGSLLDEYMIDHCTSSTYYAQGQRTGGGDKQDSDKDPEKSTSASPFSLVYGAETVLPVELSVPFARMILAMENSMEGRRADLEALEERWVAAALAHGKYWESVACYYNKGGVLRVFKVGDLVWKATTGVMRDLKTPKFTPRWEGPYEVVKDSMSGYYHLARIEDGFRTGAINSRYIKRFYP
ncbi:uncharacterized protein LOC131328442 [Rhododendron vialii]|uniref:uncharacterized protein LOC131328442 n=1 Tax=Rhododendron vialii TaxID=182163 RepID=UPI00265E2377|nr:uncharacterized protein LOC131328442 [Rhododendron vialii]